MPENATTPAIPHGQFRFETGLHGLIRAFVLGPERDSEPILHTGKAVVERQDVHPNNPLRFVSVDVYSHNNGRTWGVENGRYDLTYNDAVRHLIQALIRCLPTVPDWFTNRSRASDGGDMTHREPRT